MRFVFSLLLFALVGCAPEPEPVPLPTAVPRPVVGEVFASYLPVTAAFNDCPESSGKAAIALSGFSWGQTGYEVPLGLLCIDELVFHRWQCDPLHETLPAVDGVEIPMVWSYDKNGFPYLEGCFRGFLEKYRARTGGDYDGPVMCCNECDRPDQCALDPEGVADLIIGIYRECPGCRLVGPGYSKADDGQLARMAWIWVWRKCGVEGLCDVIRAGFLAHNPHFFLDHSGRTIERHLNEFCDFIDGEVIVYHDGEGVERVRRKPDGVLTPCVDPLWPTVGRLLCSAGRFGDVLPVLEGRGDVPRYFVYTVRTAYVPCMFDYMVDFSADGRVRLRPMGEAFRMRGAD